VAWAAQAVSIFKTVGLGCSALNPPICRRDRSTANPVVGLKAEEGALPATGYLPPRVRTSRRSCGGRSWWAHFEFTRINIEPIIPKNKIEE
jgi:hypothetical protein